MHACFVCTLVVVVYSVRVCEGPCLSSSQYISVQYAVVHYTNYWLQDSGSACVAGVRGLGVLLLCCYRSMCTALKETINRQIITQDTVIPAQRQRESTANRFGAWRRSMNVVEEQRGGPLYWRRVDESVCDCT